jgi:hypothetical protein
MVSLEAVKPVSLERTNSSNKPAAMVAPMKHHDVEAEKEAAAAVQEQQQQPKKREQNVKIFSKSPDDTSASKLFVRKRILAPISSPKMMKKAEKEAEAETVEQPPRPTRKRARISAPEVPTPTTMASMASKTASVSSVMLDVCKFWPKCNRGSACHFSHPAVKKAPPIISNISPALPSTRDKFKWTSAAK